MKVNEDQARHIVNAIFDELSDRGGIGDQLDMIADDTEVYNEMYAACVKRATEAPGDRADRLVDRWEPEV